MRSRRASPPARVAPPNSRRQGSRHRSGLPRGFGPGEPAKRGARRANLGVGGAWSSPIAGRPRRRAESQRCLGVVAGMDRERQRLARPPLRTPWVPSPGGGARDAVLRSGQNGRTNGESERGRARPETRGYNRETRKPPRENRVPWELRVRRGSRRKGTTTSTVIGTAPQSLNGSLHCSSF
jgi:hypothetical protein